MKKNGLIFIAITVSFCFGFVVKTVSTKQLNTQTMKKVTGIGGIFFKCKDPKQITEWYKNNLGLTTNPYGATFEWYQDAQGKHKAQTQWTPFGENSKSFDKQFMINYRVENLEALVEELKKANVTIVDKMETYDFGKFIHILDPEGNKIELWEPID